MSDSCLDNGKLAVDNWFDPSKKKTLEELEGLTQKRNQPIAFRVVEKSAV